MDKPKKKIFHGWWIVGAVLMISAFVSGIVAFGFTAIIEPIAAEFGWSYAGITLAGSIRGLEIGLLAPLVGILLDRIGPRKLLMSGGLLTGLGLILLSRISNLAMFYAVYILIAAGLSTSIGVVPVTVVGYWFKRRLSLVTGIAVSGPALGGLFVPLSARIIDGYGWRTAMILFGTVACCLIIPLSLVVRHRPESIGCLPDGDLPQGAPAGSPASRPAAAPLRPSESGATLRQALSSRYFWHLEVGFICHVFGIHAVVTHVMPYLGSIGIGRLSASLVASAIPLFSILGRLSFGWFGDRWDKRRVTAAGLGLTMISLLLFSVIDRMGVVAILAFALLFSIGYGGPVPMNPTMLRERFGSAHLGAIIGASQGVAMIGSISGQPLAGWIYDTSGSYLTAWLVFAAANALGIISLLTAPRPGGDGQSRSGRAAGAAPSQSGAFLEGK